MKHPPPNSDVAVPTVPTGQAAPGSRRWPALVCGFIVVCVGWLCFVQGRAEPHYLFWDENYHVTSAERYLQGVAHFEPHPPLALMLIAAGEKLSGTNQGIDKHVLVTKKQISGDELPKGFDFSGMRLMPALFAVFGGVAFYGLMLALFANPWQALLLSGLYLFENAFAVHFRAVHLDSFQICFCTAALWRFVVLWQRQAPLRAVDYAGVTALVALGIMVKVNAVVLLLLPVLLYLREAWARHRFDVLDFTRKSGTSVLSLLAVFYLVFLVHTALVRTLPDVATPAGKQDIDNMSPQYLEFLRNHGTLTPGLVVVVARDYFRFMDKDHLGVPKLNPANPGENGSHPLHWPFHDRNINYRWDSADGKTSYVELIGNQLAWYSGTAAVFFSLLLVSNRRLFGMKPACSMRTYGLIEAFTALYVAFMVMNLWLIQQRVMYLYHYFIGLILSYVLLALVWRYVCEVKPRFGRWRTRILAGFMTACFVSYMFFLPLNNHWPLTKAQCERRNIWISHLLDCR